MHVNAALVECLSSALSGNPDLVAYPNAPFYQSHDVGRWNLDIKVEPAAVTFPTSSEQVAAVVKCAVHLDLKVQAKCGGHSYGNFGVGGVDDSVVVDLKHFQQFSMDRSTWHATIGGGTLLKDVTQRLHDAGGRAMAHGTCPAVGIGGHATIGGLGPTSRQWGSALDHVEEVEVVLANSSIVRASEIQNEDIFWAVKGAGSSFGIVTEFVVRTEPEPGEVVQFAYSWTTGSYSSMAKTFEDWQTFVSDPQLSRKLATEVVITEAGMIISGAYFGARAEFEAMGFATRFFHSSSSHTHVLDGWLGAVGHWAEDQALLLGSGEPVPLFAKSLVFNSTTLIPSKVIRDLFTYLDKTLKRTPLWFVIFDLEGGAVNDVHPGATAYSHRDALFYMQSYAVGMGWVTDTTRDFIRGLHSVITTGMPEVEFGAYAGYVDVELGDEGPRAYWNGNLPRLEKIKRAIDPNEVFWNPQSVRPAPKSG
ncbi:FAD binding domain-containing protein [Xylariaceae sp. FL0016]|nr:FAD binding domain-containing protein [Xylariaceae sp. FL0016]